MADLFYCPGFEPGAQHVTLELEESRHIRKVLRKKAGETIDLTDGRGHRITGLVSDSPGREVSIKIEDIEKVPFPIENRIEVAVSVIRPNRMDWAVEKLVELGVEKISPLVWSRTVYEKIKTDHLSRIAVSAMKQSNQYHLPEIGPLQKGSEWLLSVGQQSGLKLIAHPGTEFITSLTRFSGETGNIVAAIGPEGGFDEKELKMATDCNFHQVSLSHTILRTETAAVTAVSQLKFIFEQP